MSNKPGAHGRRHLSGLRDAEFIAGDFLEPALPKDKVYLNRYFLTEQQRAFVRYFLIFGSHRHFCDHTGYACSKRNLQLMEVKVRQLEEAHARAKAEMDLETLEAVERGRYRLPGKGKAKARR